MLVEPELIGWGKYGGYEGPFYRGLTPYREPEKPTPMDKLIAVFTATEGGRYEALNMYDKCILSLGLLQYCEVATIYAVSRILGRCVEADRALFESYLDLFPLGLLPKAPTFKRNPKGSWRFYVGNSEVTSKAAQQELLLSTNGREGSWGAKDSPQRLHAKTVAAIMVSMMHERVFQEAQESFMRSTVLDFVLPWAKKELYLDHPQEAGWLGAMQAGFLSFAGNNPKIAHEQLRVSMRNWDGLTEEQKCFQTLRQLTFGPGISIYPHRYDAIRKPIERLYQVDLPDFSEELRAWSLSTGHTCFWSTEEVQTALHGLGYDLGPAGVDGKWGPKTEGALKKFEEDHGLPPDGIMDTETADVLFAEFESVDAQTAEYFMDLSKAVERGDYGLEYGMKKLREMYQEEDSAANPD